MKNGKYNVPPFPVLCFLNNYRELKTWLMPIEARGFREGNNLASY